MSLSLSENASNSLSHSPTFSGKVNSQFHVYGSLCVCESIRFFFFFLLNSLWYSYAVILSCIICSVLHVFWVKFPFGSRELWSRIMSFLFYNAGLSWVGFLFHCLCYLNFKYPKVWFFFFFFFSFSFLASKQFSYWRFHICIFAFNLITKLLKS